MNKILRYVVLFSVILAIISTASYCSAPFDTEVAQIVNVRKTVVGDGYIIRSETVITPDVRGAFEAAVDDGVRVSRGSSIGAVISGNYSEELVNKLNEVTLRIEEIEKSNDFADIYASDEARIFSALKDLTSEIRDNVREGDFRTASENSAHLETILQKKYSAENKGAAEELLLQLQQEKYELEQELGGIRVNVAAPASGKFYSELDGLERTVREDELFKITPSEVNGFEDTLKSYTKSGTEAGKITDTYVWYLVSVIPKDEAEFLTVGNSVTVSLDDATAVSATVSAINPDNEGNCSIVLKCTRDVKDIYEKRRVDFEICYQEYKGFYVPTAAIRVVDGVKGVYILNQNKTVSFRAIEILLQEENYFVVKSNYIPPEGAKYPALKLYDDILVNPEVANPNELEE